MAERGVRSAKHLLEKCARDGSDIYAALVNLRNTPRDGLASPAQRLLSQRTRSLIPMVPSPLTPRVEPNVHAAFFALRQKGKKNHDKSARCLSPLEPGQTVRMEKTCGIDTLAMVSGKALYVKNRCHLLQVPESYCPAITTSVTMIFPEPQGNSIALQCHMTLQKMDVMCRHHKH